MPSYPRTLVPYTLFIHFPILLDYLWVSSKTENLTTFSDLGVSETYLKALEEIGILNPTEIQIKAIPFLIAKGKDFIGQAQTGTGKTAAFGLPILHAVNPDDSHIQALILWPTRELGQQIAKQLFKFTKYASKKVFIESVYGGARIDNQISALKRPTHILVATPGRLVDLLEKKAVDLSSIRTIVLDCTQYTVLLPRISDRIIQHSAL